MSTQVDQAIASLKKAEDFITCGLVAIPDFASEFAAVDTPDQTKVLNDYRDLMKKYVAMENDYRSFMSSVDEIKTMITRSELNPEDVNDKLTEIFDGYKGDQQAVTTHEAYRDLERKIAAHGGETEEQEMGDDEDLMVQEETQNFKCPYTGQEMVEPVKNTACGHTYDKEGILVYIKQRGKRAKCPVPGCTNQGFITTRSLVPDKKMKKELEKKNKQTKK